MIKEIEELEEDLDKWVLDEYEDGVMHFVKPFAEKEKYVPTKFKKRKAEEVDAGQPELLISFHKDLSVEDMLFAAKYIRKNAAEVGQKCNIILSPYLVEGGAHSVEKTLYNICYELGENGDKK